MENLCETCRTDQIVQRCCTRITDLMLTDDEYSAHFQQHEKDLFVKHANGVYAVTPRNGNPCPQWSRGGCTIYRDRPLDCRLYPYQMARIRPEKDTLRIRFETSSICPQTELFLTLMPETEARALIEEFWRKVVGDEVRIVIERESGFASRLRSWLQVRAR